MLRRAGSPNDRNKTSDAVEGMPKRAVGRLDYEHGAEGTRHDNPEATCDEE
jgi:hypothetical protein